MYGNLKRGEDTEQMGVIDWANWNTGRFPELKLLFHVPNGGKRNAAEAARFKAMGVKAGVPDLCLPVARGGYAGLYIEMKYGKNKTTEKQEEWIHSLIEQAIVCGTGVNMPIGMMKDISAAKRDGEVYPDKEAVKITKFDAQQYGGVIAKLAVSRNGRPRKVGAVIMVVNPVDYFNKVMPATTVQRPDGTFANDVLPYPTTIIQSEEVPQGKAVVGIAEKYFMGVGTSKDGVIEYDDSYKFLQRERVYAAFLYGNGKPVDNNCFVVLDISALEAATYTVTAYSEKQTVEVEVEKKSWTSEELNAMTVDQIDGLAKYIPDFLIKGLAVTQKMLNNKAEIPDANNEEK